MKIISSVSNTVGSIANATQSVAGLVEKTFGDTGLGKLTDQLFLMSELGLKETLDDMDYDREERAIQRTYKLEQIKREYNIKNLDKKDAK